MQPLDQYFLLRAAEVTKDVREHYDDFVFHRLYHRLKDFCIVDLSAIYFDVLKDRLYTSAPKSLARRSAQTALWRLGEALVRLLAPVMSFTAEEIWGFLPAVDGRPESVHVTLFPQPEELTGAIPGDFNVAALAKRLGHAADGPNGSSEGSGDRPRGEEQSAEAWRHSFMWPLPSSSFRCWNVIAISCAICLSFRMWCWRSHRPATATRD